MIAASTKRRLRGLSVRCFVSGHPQPRMLQSVRKNFLLILTYSNPVRVVPLLPTKISTTNLDKVTPHSSAHQARRNHGDHLLGCMA